MRDIEKEVRGRRSAGAAGGPNCFPLVDDERRDQDEQVALLLASVALREQLADQRQVAEERNPRAVLDDLRLGEAADDRSLAVGDEQLVVGAALVEEESEIATDDVQPRLLG